MSNQSSIYNEKKIAYYEATYKTGAFAKPLDVNVTLTAEHVYGLAYIMEQSGTIEGDPVYTRFTCSLDEVSKVYINDNARQSALYIQCDTVIKGGLNRKRIIVPCLKNASEAAAKIQEIKNQYDEKNEKSKERAKAKAVPAAPDSIRVEITPPAQSVPEHTSEHEKNPEKFASKAKDIKDMAADKMKDFDFDKLKKKAGNFLDNFSKTSLSIKRSSGKQAPVIPDEIANANAAAEAALSAFTAPLPPKKNEASAPVPAPAPEQSIADDETAKANKAAEEALKAFTAPLPPRKSDAAAPAPAAEESSAAVPEIKPLPSQPAVQQTEISSAKKTDQSSEAEQQPARKAQPKVTAADLLKFNDSLDLDFMTGGEPPINRIKKGADKYLDDIGGNYVPAAKHGDLTEVDGRNASNILLEDIGDTVAVHEADVPDLSQLESEVGGGILLSDMSGNAVDISSEVTPAEYMDYVHKPKAHTETAVSEPDELPDKPETEMAVNAAEEIPEKPAIAAENAYIDDETTADTETISPVASETEEVPEVKNVHIDFSTEVSQDTSLDEFQDAVKKLKSMLDSNLITKEEFMAEKKKLLSALY